MFGWNNACDSFYLCNESRSREALILIKCGSYVFDEGKDDGFFLVVELDALRTIKERLGHLTLGLGIVGSIL